MKKLIQLKTRSVVFALIAFTILEIYNIYYLLQVQVDFYSIFNLIMTSFFIMISVIILIMKKRGNNNEQK